MITSRETRKGHKASPSKRAKGPRNLRIALVDNDEAAHAEVRKMLATHVRDWRLDSYRDAILAVRGLPTAQPHVVLMDLCVPGHSGIDCARKLKAIVPELPVVMFTTRSDSDGILLSLQAGACGYLIKPVAHRHFFTAVTSAAQGRLALCEHAERVLVNWFQRLATNSLLGTLTSREQEILPSILHGLSDKEISKRLPFRTDTAHGHRTNLYKKFGAHSSQDFIDKFLAL